MAISILSAGTRVHTPSSWTSNGGIPEQHFGAGAALAEQLFVVPSGFVESTSLRRRSSAVKGSNSSTTSPPPSCRADDSTGPVQSELVLQGAGAVPSVAAVGHTRPFGISPWTAKAACTVWSANRREISFLFGGWSEPHADLPPRSSVTATPEMSVRPLVCGTRSASANLTCIRPVLRLVGARGSAVDGSEGGSCTVMNAKSPIPFRSRQSATIAWSIVA
mmetsp:Transcript_3417/g.10536  ORF Transcript_3417/g.10536 Transcript_3417/m.10536 type:complete len:220 (+) Transcript_3417:1963-2622(+)